MSAVFVIAQVAINDRETYAKYEETFMEILSDYDAKLVGFAEPPEVIEGAFEGTRAVIAEFASRDELDRWYNSPAYQDILRHRLAASDGSVIVVPRVG